MTSPDLIVALNRDQEVSETDPFNERCYEPHAACLMSDATLGAAASCEGPPAHSACHGHRSRVGTHRRTRSAKCHAKICEFTNALPFPSDSFDVVARERIHGGLTAGPRSHIFRIHHLLQSPSKLLFTMLNPRYPTNRAKTDQCASRRPYIPTPRRESAAAGNGRRFLAGKNQAQPSRIDCDQQAHSVLRRSWQLFGGRPKIVSLTIPSCT